MFVWNHALYMDDKVKQHPKRYRRMIERKKVLKSCYCITLPANEKNCLDIYSSREFWFRHYDRQSMHIVGLAGNKDSAQELLCCIMQAVYQEYGTVDAVSIRQFFQEKN